MDSLFDILKNKQNQKVVNREKWQIDALEASQKLVDGQKYLGSIMKCYKQNSHYAQISFNECKELNKPFSRYFLKVFNSLRKKI